MYIKAIIPKVIHFCWFGGNTKGAIVKKCISSWKKQMPDCDIIEWNEKNFDIQQNKFTYEAYMNRKWAFVSDYVRLWALYNYGGIYLDSDVELIKPLDEFLKYPAFGGFSGTEDVGGTWEIPSAVMGSCAYNLWIKEMLDYYTERSFILPNGKMDLVTNAAIMTRLSEKYFLKKDVQQTMSLGDVELFPMEYFEPINIPNGINILSENSYAIHWHNCSWCKNTVYSNFLQKFRRIFQAIKNSTLL